MLSVWVVKEHLKNLILITLFFHVWKKNRRMVVYILNSIICELLIKRCIDVFWTLSDGCLLYWLIESWAVSYYSIDHENECVWHYRYWSIMHCIIVFLWMICAGFLKMRVLKISLHFEKNVCLSMDTFIFLLLGDFIFVTKI